MEIDFKNKEAYIISDCFDVEEKTCKFFNN